MRGRPIESASPRFVAPFPPSPPPPDFCFANVESRSAFYTDGVTRRFTASKKRNCAYNCDISFMNM